MTHLAEIAFFPVCKACAGVVPSLLESDAVSVGNICSDLEF